MITLKPNRGWEGLPQISKYMYQDTYFLPGETYDEYKVRVFENRDAMLVKVADLRHNTDIRRLKGVTQKDIERTAKYYEFYAQLQVLLND